MTAAKKTVQDLIAQGQTRRALEALRAACAADPELLSEATALSGRFQNYLREKNGGRAEPHWLDTELNRINTAALDLLERLPDEVSPAPVNWKRYTALAAGSVAFLGAVAEFSGWSLRDIFQKPAPTQVEAQPPTGNVAPPNGTVAPIDVHTSGANSPAVNAPNGSVIINYGETEPAKGHAKKDSLVKK